MEKKQLEILGISNSQTQSGAYALILTEANGKRRLPIIIGGFEAQAIAIELEGMQPNRPLTHDLFKRFADTFNITLTEVLINKFQEGVFYARLICRDALGNEFDIDSRTSDAIALAVRFKCDIFTYEPVLEAAGIEVESPALSIEKDESSTLEGIENTEFSDLSDPELEELLDELIRNENYEKASLVRDEINRRKK